MYPPNAKAALGGAAYKLALHKKAYHIPLINQGKMRVIPVFLRPAKSRRKGGAI